MSALLWTDREQQALAEIIRLALAEDVGPGDLTTQVLVPAGATGRAAVVVRQAGVIAGLAAAAQAFRAIDPVVRFEMSAADGARVTPGQTVAVVSGAARSLLTGERLALNLLGRMAGIASLTRQYVDLVSGTRAGIFDTRKTTPGWRLLEKYAVRAGGGRNHRIGLFDAVLIKDNHLAFGAANEAGRYTPAEAVARARASVPAGTVIEVEVDTLEQFDLVLPAGPDIVLLDNMPVDMLRAAVARRNATHPKIELEASGGVNLATVAAIAGSGVERISVGALTHSAVALDVGLDWG
jgi:nicotinate-nucleotide pyrophosphorylase (carboxylating)